MATQRVCSESVRSFRHRIEKENKTMHCYSRTRRPSIAHRMDLSRNYLEPILQRRTAGVTRDANGSEDRIRSMRGAGISACLGA